MPAHSLHNNEFRMGSHGNWMHELKAVQLELKARVSIDNQQYVGCKLVLEAIKEFKQIEEMLLLQDDG